MKTLNAETLASEYVAAYGVVRRQFPIKEEWARFFTDRKLFTRLILNKSAEPPDQIRECGTVLAQVASAFGVHYFSREPLRLDAVFSRQPHWAPMCVAIEHENHKGTFEQETQKLLSLRCPLKVGITYIYNESVDNRAGSLKTLCERKIQRQWDAAYSQLGDEAEGTEYLFLAGSETESKELQWYYKAFLAADGYQSGFKPIS